MVPELRHAVMPVICSDTSHTRFGTAFVIHRSYDPDRLFLLTCAHVIRHIREVSDPIIYPYVTNVLAISPESDSDDIAIIELSKEINRDIDLSIEGRRQADERFDNARVLPLAPFGNYGQQCDVYGFYEYIEQTEFRAKALEGVLADSSEIVAKKQIHTTTTWEISFTGSGVALQPGYSGSPVWNDEVGMVVAITRIREGELGKIGQGVCVGALRRLLSLLPTGYNFFSRSINAMVDLAAKTALPGIPDQNGIPDCNLLPFLADRKPQLRKFSEIADEYLEKSGTSPIICVLHGKEKQRHDRFILSLANHHWKERYYVSQQKRELDTHHIGLPRISFDDYEDFKDILLDELPPKRHNAAAMGYNSVANLFNTIHYKPSLLYLQINSEEWQESNGQILDYFIRFWQDWPSRSKGSLLFVCLAVTYKDLPSSTGFFSTLVSRFKSEPDIHQIIHQQLADAAKNCAQNPFYIFDEFGGISHRMATNWSQLEIIKHLCGGYDFEPCFRSIYREEQDLPMEEFAAHMKSELEKILTTCL